MFYIVYARRDLGKLDFSIAAKANGLSEMIASCSEMCLIICCIQTKFPLLLPSRESLAMHILLTEDLNF